MDTTDQASALVLTAAEARVLGCLIEKEATTPDAYPLTVNAAQVAANQKTARDPVMALNVGDVNHALRQLEQKGLAKQVFSSRAERYEHRADKALDLSKQQLTLVGVLLLRGPQTVHELLARSERLASFNDAEDVRHHLDRLIQRQPALVQQIPRGPGQREDRYVHLLSGAIDVAAVTARIASSSSSSEASSPALEARVQALENEVAELRAAVAALTGRTDQA
ncbi:YceH family protein [Pseudoxanthomonas sacheonensis]|uniref:Uncharacterized protein YceH (UPF0502 family) n=1 Tax=Pseudoxanthomonas sacheonensis TaxID=443615 RepID=A0ABU1RSZ9_9GAMM|nr:DUF480 domain-containing protein [Pseudoxanthomonas sacheonensis]MDR6841903.1 uncharacterized protein YceH (UPF0502 family) [Pseudoxanthomonas sacheonensis]